MFVIFGRKTKLRPLERGAAIRRRCPACGEEAKIVACERVHTYRAYFVDLLDTTKAVWVCTACQEEVELPDALPQGRAEAEAAERARLEEQARASRREQLADRAESVKRRVEDELAALKARLGRK